MVGSIFSSSHSPKLDKVLRLFHHYFIFRRLANLRRRYSRRQLRIIFGLIRSEIAKHILSEPIGAVSGYVRYPRLISIPGCAARCFCSTYGCLSNECATEIVMRYLFISCQ